MKRKSVAMENNRNLIKGIFREQKKNLWKFCYKVWNITKEQKDGNKRTKIKGENQSKRFTIQLIVFPERENWKYSRKEYIKEMRKFHSIEEHEFLHWKSSKIVDKKRLTDHIVNKSQKIRCKYLKNVQRVKTGCTKSIRKQTAFGFLEARIQWNNVFRILKEKCKGRAKTLLDMQILVDSYICDQPITLELPFYIRGNSHIISPALPGLKSELNYPTLVAANIGIWPKPFQSNWKTSIWRNVRKLILCSIYS